jgi:hypothetical protein
VIKAFSSEVDAGSREENASKQESSADNSVRSRRLMPALRPTMIANQRFESEAQAAFRQPVVRLYEEQETSLDRKIAIAA